VAANLADVLLHTGGEWPFGCEFFNTVTDSAVNNVSANPSYKLH
jgi:hypothetical protein